MYINLCMFQETQGNFDFVFAAFKQLNCFLWSYNLFTWLQRTDQSKSISSRQYNGGKQCFLILTFMLYLSAHCSVLNILLISTKIF